MPKRFVEIKWDAPEYEGWLADDNIAYALRQACPNTSFVVKGIRAGGEAFFDWWMIAKDVLMQDESVGLAGIAKAGWEAGRRQIVLKSSELESRLNNDVECSCADWKQSADQIFMSQIRDTLHTGNKYTGRMFEFCPWCGKSLVKTKSEDKQGDSHA